MRYLALNIEDMAILRGLVAEKLAATDPRFKTSVTKAPLPYDEVPLYLGINKAAYARDPKRIEAIWNAIRAVRNSDEYKKLVQAAEAR